MRTGSWTGPPRGGEGFKGRNQLDCIRGKGVRYPELETAPNDAMPPPPATYHSGFRFPFIKETNGARTMAGSVAV